MKEVTDENGDQWIADDKMYELFHGKLCPCVLPNEENKNNPDMQCNPCPRLLRGEKKDLCAVYKKIKEE